MKLINRLVRICIAMLMVSLCGACTFHYAAELTDKSLADIALRDKHSIQRSGDWRIKPNTGVAFTLVDETVTPLPRTTRNLNNALKQYFPERFPTSVAFDPAPIAEQLTRAAITNNPILFVVSIRSVENGLNTTNELIEGQFHHPNKRYGRDTLELQLLIYDSRQRRLLDTVNLSSEAAFFKSEDKIPLHLLDDSIKNLLAVI